MKVVFLFTGFILFVYSVRAENAFLNSIDSTAKYDSCIVSNETVVLPCPLLFDSLTHILNSDSLGHSQKRKKVIAAVLAFPLPFGILGLHRIFLGTKPYIPFVYIGTLGGCLGILPLIDFIAILSSKENNSNPISISQRELNWLLDGLELEQKHAHKKVTANIVI